MLHTPRVLPGALYCPRVGQWQLHQPHTEILQTGLPRALLQGRRVPFAEPATGRFQHVAASTDTWRCTSHFVSSMPATFASRNSRGLVIWPPICASPMGHLTHVVSDALATPKQSYLPAEAPVCLLCLHLMALLACLLCSLTLKFTWQFPTSFDLLLVPCLRACFVCQMQDILRSTPSNHSFILLWPNTCCWGLILHLLKF